MSKRRLWSGVALGAAIIMVLGMALVTPASAAKAEPTVNTVAWYWVDAHSQEQEVPNVGTVTIETPNPYCPRLPGELGSPAEQTCSPGRLPIEVHNGEYKDQNKISAVNFDMSLIPIGSQVSKFSVTFREAKTGCYDKNGTPNDPNDDACEETDPVNVEGHKLQACLVTQFFGDGEARPYNETPKYECVSGSPSAERKQMTVKGAGPGSDFYWTFDLTSYAQNWVKNFTTLAGIMIVGLPAKNEGDQSDTWRVVLAGPKFQDGVITSVVYDEPANPPTTTGGGTGGGTTTTTGGGTGFGTTTTGGGTTFGTDPGTGTGTTDPGTGGAPAPAPSTSPVTATQDIPEVQEFPAYMWLAILAGLVGFSLVRSVVIEQTTGIRPNGVLATIHRINADRTGASSTASPSGGGSGLGNGIRNLLQKLNLRKKG